MNFPECFIFVIPGCQHLHQASELGLEVPLEVGDVPLMEVKVGLEVTLHHSLDGLEEGQEEQWENLGTKYIIYREDCVLTTADHAV